MRDGASSGLRCQEEWRAFVVDGRTVGCPAHKRPEHQVPAEYGRPECLHSDSLREIQSNTGTAAADARVCPGPSFCDTGNGDGDRTGVANEGEYQVAPGFRHFVLSRQIL